MTKLQKQPLLQLRTGATWCDLEELGELTVRGRTIDVRRTVDPDRGAGRVRTATIDPAKLPTSGRVRAGPTGAHVGPVQSEAIMKASKFIVLVGGILGILAFFLPLVSVQRGDFTGKVSAFQVVKGLDKVAVDVDAADAHTSIDVATKAEAKKDIGAMKGIVMAIFAPAALLALIGGLAVSRRRFGRGAATLCLLFGLIGLGIAAILEGAAEGDAGIGCRRRHRGARQARARHRDPHAPAGPARGLTADGRTPRRRLLDWRGGQGARTA
jgi:hypothetical protein